MGQALFHCLYSVFLESFKGADCIGYTVTLIGIHPQADIHAHCLPDQLHGADILFIVNAGLDFQNMPAFLRHQPAGLGRHGFRRADADGYVVLYHIAVTAQEFVYRLSQGLSHQIVHGQVHGTFCSAISNNQAIHHCVYGFDIHGIHSHQSLPEQLQHGNDTVHGLTGDRGKWGGFAISHQAFVHSYLDQHAFQIADRCKCYFHRFF